MSDLIKCGYLEMKLPRKHRKFGLKKNMFFVPVQVIPWQPETQPNAALNMVWRQKWFTLRRKSGKKQHRLEYHKSEESCLKGKHTTIIPLQNLIAIELATSKTHEHVFKLVFRDGIKSLFFSAHNESEMKEWIRIIRKLTFPEPKVMPVQHGTSPEGFYSVTIVCTEDSEKLSLAGDYLLSVSPEQLKLCKRESQNIAAVQWHLEDIPRFRLQRLCHLHDGEKIFIINVARTSPSGDGEFHFLTQNGRNILENVKSYTRRLHQGRIHDDSPRSTPLGVPSSLSSSAIMDSRSRSSSNNSQSLSLRPAYSVTSRSSKSS